MQLGIATYEAKLANDQYKETKVDTDKAVERMDEANKEAAEAMGLLEAARRENSTLKAKFDSDKKTLENAIEMFQKDRKSQGNF